MARKHLRRRRSENLLPEKDRSDDEYAVHAATSTSDSERYVRLGRSVFQIHTPQKDPLWVTVLEPTGGPRAGASKSKQGLESQATSNFLQSAAPKSSATLWICLGPSEVVGVIAAVSLTYYSYYYFDHLHFHVTHGYAHLGYPAAQHVVGQKYLAGKGTEKNDTKAMEWFKAAAKQGHPEASFNLAVGHIHGSQTGLKRGEPEKLLRFAAGKGVDAAHHALNLCARRGCD